MFRRRPGRANTASHFQKVACLSPGRAAARDTAAAYVLGGVLEAKASLLFFACKPTSTKNHRADYANARKKKNVKATKNLKLLTPRSMIATYSTLHMGHWLVVSPHLTMQAKWKACAHLSKDAASSSPVTAHMQMEQSTTSSPSSSIFLSLPLSWPSVKPTPR